VSDTKGQRPQRGGDDDGWPAGPRRYTEAEAERVAAQIATEQDQLGEPADRAAFHGVLVGGALVAGLGGVGRLLAAAADAANRLGYAHLAVAAMDVVDLVLAEAGAAGEEDDAT